MAVQQYLRKASLIIGQQSGDALDLSALRFRFDVRRGDTQTPNSADIRVYNVSEETAAKVQKEFTRVVLQAGYGGNYGVIFDGTVTQVRRGRETPTDTYLDITAADGDSAYNYAMCAYSLVASDTEPQNAVQTIIKQLAQYSVEAGYKPDLNGNPLPRGKAVYGMARDEMRKLAANTGTSWSIQDGKLNMIPLTAYVPGEIPVLTFETGMVGLPEQTQNGISIQLLLNPNIKIGQAVKIDNASIQRYRKSLQSTQQYANANASMYSKLNMDGLYYVMMASHRGDTRGNDWYSDLICLAIDATVPSEYKGNSALDAEPIVSAIKEFG